MAFENNVNEAIDQHAPEKNEDNHCSTQQPLVHQRSKGSEKSCSQQGRIWQKYRHQEHWIVLKSERRKYCDMLRRIRTDKITEKVTECAGNTKKLYSLVSYLTGLETENSMPPGKMDDKLAE